MSWGMMAEHMGWGIIDGGWRKGPWTAEEDKLLMEYVKLHGEGRWNSVARLAGLKRNGKSCRLRWVNYLRPDLKRGQITPNEENIIIELHARWGNRWSTIARSLPGRTDNEIKNYWRTHFKKTAKKRVSTDCNDHQPRACLLRRQQQQQQQQNQFDLKKMMIQREENDNRSVPYIPQLKQDMSTIYPNTAEEQALLCSMFSGYEPFCEDNLWEGLWNLDDAHAHAHGNGNGNLSSASVTSKAGLHDLSS